MLTFLAAADLCFFAQVSADVYNGELFLPAHLPGRAVPAGPGRAPPGQAAHEAGAQLGAGERPVLSCPCSLCLGCAAHSPAGLNSLGCSWCHIPAGLGQERGCGGRS